MIPATNIHVVVTRADDNSEEFNSKVYLEDMDSMDYNNNNLKGIRMFREIINKLKLYQKHQKHEQKDARNRDDFTWNNSPYSSRSSSSSSENSKSSSNSSSQNRLDNITGYLKLMNINSNASPSSCKQKKLLRSPTTYTYIKGMSGLHSRVPKY